MYTSALEFLDEEREAWRPFEVLADLPDDALAQPVEAAHGWSARELMAHLLAWQGIALQAARELSIGETAPSFARSDAEQDAEGIDTVNERLAAEWAAVPLTELRERFRTQPGELRGQLTTVPEVRWLKHAGYLRKFLEDTVEHYEEHLADAHAILEAAR